MDRGEAVKAVWFTGESSRRTAVTVREENGIIYAEGADGEVCREPLANMQISSRLARVPRRLQLPSGGVLLVSNNEFIDQLLARAGRHPGRIHAMESHWRMVVVLTAAAAALSFAAYAYGLPRAAGYVARHIPDEYVQEISETVLQNLQEYNLIYPTGLSEEQQQRVQRLFDAAAADYKADAINLRLGFYRMRFFAAREKTGKDEDKSKDVAADISTGKDKKLWDGVPNAFAFPDGLIVATDALVKLLSDDEITAVLAHEIGHVYHRHSMRGIVQTAGVSAMVFFLLGDFSGLSLVPIILAELKHSRDFEREADCFAFYYLQAQGLSGDLVGESLTKLENEMESDWREAAAVRQEEETGEQREEAAQPEEGSKLWRAVAESLSTHPATDARQDLARQCRNN